MRSVFVLLIMASSFMVKAQTFFPGSYIDYAQRQSFANNLRLNDSAHNKKWFVNTSASISTSFNFFRGGNATVIAAPLSLQLNRKLNDNLYAFAGVSVAPAYINFNRSFLTSSTNKGWQNNGIANANSIGMYSRAEMGLMYINDQRTFSISGSISIEKSSYPMMPYSPAQNTRTNSLNHSN